jgi:filamentous hemagglutinin family protein
VYPIIRYALFEWLACSLPLCLLIATNPAIAQIVPDNTLRVNSVVTPQGNIKLINGGTVAGSNLFHSFQEFSVLTGETASFNNPLTIQNILTRVTGNSVSNINGLLKASNANLFLINPNGIIFGRNATLDIGGSFVASTASSIKFPDGNEFSAINPQSTSLLSITVPLGLQFPGMSANIISRAAKLEVSPGKTIALVGGNVTLEGSQLTAPQGRIELGSVAGNSLVNLNPTANGWTLGYSGINNFGNIQLSQSIVSASGANSGNIQVQGDRITLTDGSGIVADNSVRQNGGEIFVRATNLTVTNGSKITVQALNEGNAGRINVQADAVEVSGASPDSQVFSTIAATSRGTGDSGSINITTNRLTARDSGDVSVTTFNSGKGGNLTVNASEFIELIGDRISSDGEDFSRSGLFAATEGTGNGGNITINTPNLRVLDGGRVSVSTRRTGGGTGGNLLVNAKVIELSGTGSIELSGTGPNRRFASGLFALSGERRPGIAENEATGNGGDIRIETGQLTIQNGAQLSASTANTGKGGNITVQADVIDITGTSILNQGFSTLAATSRGTGDSGNITIDTRQLRVSDGADISVTAFGTGNSGFGRGNPGELNIRASDSIELIGVSVIPNSNIFSRSGLFAATEGTKDGGSITVNTPRLMIKDGAIISVSTRGMGENGIPGGRGGNLIVNASDRIDLSGIGQVQLVSDGQIETSRFASGLFALSGERRPNIPENVATGIGGNLEINTGLLSIRDGAQVSVSARGSGPAGNLQARASEIKLDNGSIIGSTVSGNGANINLQVQDSLQLRGNSQISTTAAENGNGGNITITAGTLAILENSSIRADAGRLGGNVQITTQGLFALGNAISASSALGTQFSGIVTINTPDVTPSQGLVQPPVFGAENQVAQACAAEAGKDSSQFIITGRGGLPPSPTEPLSSEAVRVSGTERSLLPLNNYPRPATGWLVNSKGEVVVLTANAANLTQTSRLPTANCHVR